MHFDNINLVDKDLLELFDEFSVNVLLYNGSV